MEIEPMNKPILVVALIVAATSAAWAQEDYNGAVIGDVLRNPASGCGYGIGYSGPGCPVGGYYTDGSGHTYYRFGPGNDFPQPAGQGTAKRAPRSARARSSAPH
jgi:hypothetical protein